MENSSAPFGVLPDGRTYGPVPDLDGSELVGEALLAAMPDLVAVIGDGGKQGYADARIVYGDDGVDNPRQAAEVMTQRAAAAPRTLPVFDLTGETIDVFTIR